MAENQFPGWLRPHPDDKAFTEGQSIMVDRLCSRCLKPISERTVPIMFWTESGEYMWQYHPVCLGIQEYDNAEVD